jgi:hypothetical protein
MYNMSVFTKKSIYVGAPGPNANRHIHAHKCLHCAGIEPVTSCVVGEYSRHYIKSAVNVTVME